MPTSKTTAEQTLFNIASEQQGYFTTSQAIMAGFQDATHPYHVKNGDWIREWRGIYRIARYPLAENGQYVLWSLWSRNRKGISQGVYSHQTALSLFDLSDIMPEKLHISVPPSFRRHSVVPGILVIHKNRIAPHEIEEREGFGVTKPMRTIVDLIIEESVSTEIIRQAWKESIQRGLFQQKDIKRYMNEPESSRKIRECLGETV